MTQQIVIKQSESPYHSVVVEFHNQYGILTYDYHPSLLTEDNIRRFLNGAYEDTAIQQKFHEQPFSD